MHSRNLRCLYRIGKLVISDELRIMWSKSRVDCAIIKKVALEWLGYLAARSNYSPNNVLQLLHQLILSPKYLTQMYPFSFQYFKESSVLLVNCSWIGTDETKSLIWRPRGASTPTFLGNRCASNLLGLSHYWAPTSSQLSWTGSFFSFCFEMESRSAVPVLQSLLR